MRALLIFIFLFCSLKSSFSQNTYQGLLWEIYGNGLTDTSYLYGTMHIQDERVFQFQEGVQKAFDRSVIFAMELNMDSVNTLELMSELIMESPYRLDSLLSENEYEIVNQYFKDSLGIGLLIFNKMQPIYTSQMVSLNKMNKDRAEALDIYLFNKAKEQNKIVVGLEFMEEQINAFKSIPYDIQAKELFNAVEDAINGEDQQIDGLIEYYIKGDLDRLLALTLESEFSDNEINAIFHEVFLVNRNHKMADRSEKYIKKGSTFIAIGAAHLPGNEGVIEILRKKGYTVKAF
tara:strand:+ start:2092 stop:2961 length:870 start_codon:yes stop_codon:yes gene_type:complete